MPASVTEICNRALQILGQGRITAITEQSVAARACNTCYEVLRDATLRAHRWNFAIQRASLPADAAAPAFGPNNAFTLPTGWLKLLPPDTSRNLTDRDWIIEGGRVLTNDAAPLQVRCVMKIDDATLMDPLFREALSAKMAEQMAEQLTQSNEKKADAQVKYKAAITEARKANAIENVPEDSPSDSWINSRLNSRGSIVGPVGWR